MNNLKEDLEKMNFEIIVKDENNNYVISENVNDILDTYFLAKESLEEAEKNFRTQLYDTMVANGILSANLKKYTISQIKPTVKVTFDTDSFFKNEPDVITNVFGKVQTDLVFDAERFKNENPEMYMKYCTKTESLDVEIEQLKNCFPNIYSKYATESITKQGSLRIGKKK